MIATIVCENTECEAFGVESEARASFEHGVYWLDDDDRANCEGCGEAVSVLGAVCAL